MRLSTAQCEANYVKQKRESNDEAVTSSVDDLRRRWLRIVH